MRRMLLQQIESHCNYTGVKPVAIISNAEVDGKYVLDFIFGEKSIRLKSQREGSRRFSSIAAIVKTCGSIVDRLEIKLNA